VLSTNIYQLYSYEFITLGGPLTIKFTDLPEFPGQGSSSVLDDVSLTQIESVPEPASLMQIIAGLGLLLIKRRPQ